MTKNKEKNIDKEIRSLVVLAFCLVGLTQAKGAYMPIFLAIIAIFSFFNVEYIGSHRLKFSRTVYTLLASFYNVASLFYFVQILVHEEGGQRVFDLIFSPFIKLDRPAYYIGAIFILTCFLLARLNKNWGERSEE